MIPGPSSWEEVQRQTCFEAQGVSGPQVLRVRRRRPGALAIARTRQPQVPNGTFEPVFARITRTGGDAFGTCEGEIPLVTPKCEHLCGSWDEMVLTAGTCLPRDPGTAITARPSQRSHAVPPITELLEPRSVFDAFGITSKRSSPARHQIMQSSRTEASSHRREGGCIAPWPGCDTVQVVRKGMPVDADARRVLSKSDGSKMTDIEQNRFAIATGEMFRDRSTWIHEQWHFPAPKLHEFCAEEILVLLRRRRALSKAHADFSSMAQA